MGGGSDANSFNFNVPGQRTPTDTSDQARLGRFLYSMGHPDDPTSDPVGSNTYGHYKNMNGPLQGYDASKTNPYQYLLNGGLQPQPTKTLSASASSRALLS